MKTHVRHSIAALLVLGAASGCAVDMDESAPVAEKVAVPSQQVFDYAPDGDFEAVKATQEDPLEAKGSFSRPSGSTYVQPLTIGINQTVSFSTSGGSAGADPVLVLFRRHDNQTGFVEPPYNIQRGIQTLAINDDTNGLHSSISYRNTSGRVENAWIMAFAYSSSLGTVNLTGPSGTTVATLAAGSVRASGTAGSAWTSGSTNDPWLFTFNVVAGRGDGNWRDDSTGTVESSISGNTSLEMWYVAHGWTSGTTTINN